MGYRNPGETQPLYEIPADVLRRPSGVTTNELTKFGATADAVGSGIFTAAAIPVTGSYTAGQIVLNTAAVTVQGASTSQYTVLGWRRLTTGSAHVLNTDWVEMRMLTGT